MTAQIARRTAPRPGLVLAVLAIGGCAYAGLQSLVVPALPTLQKGQTFVGIRTSSYRPDD